MLWCKMMGRRSGYLYHARMARRAHASMLRCERSERADNKLDKGSLCRGDWCSMMGRRGSLCIV